MLGKVVSTTGASSPIVVSAWRLDPSGLQLAEYVILDASGSYEMALPEGRYRITAFADANRNLRFDEGEINGAFPEGIEVVRGSSKLAVDIFLGEQWSQTTLPLGNQFVSKGAVGARGTNAGALADIDDPIFSSAYGEDEGYWEPLKFFQETGANIFALEPYDPRRIPVLFVHGVRGSPQDWKFAFQHLDRKRYQAWFYYYPTSVSLNAAGFLLAKKITDMHERYHFPRMHLVAHSAGGLVAREFLVHYGKTRPEIETFISISTPWKGEALAEFGVQHSPVVLPSWIDMRPGSDFMKRLFDRRMPEWINHHLFFGYRGGINLLRPNNDGALLLSSLLDPRAQQETRTLAGFDEDHLSILVSPDVFNKISEILREADKAYEKIPKGDLRIKTAGMTSEEMMHSQLSFLLCDQKGYCRMLYLPPGEDAIQLTSLPVGDYRLWVRAMGARGEPVEQSIHIGEKEEVQASFNLVSRNGALCGLTSRRTANMRADIPATFEPIEVSSLSLEGDGVGRKTPQSLASLDEVLFDFDFKTQGVFCFFDLPEGNYTIEVRDREDVRRANQSVKRGRLTPPLDIRF